MTKTSEFVDSTYFSFLSIFTSFYVLMYQSVAELEQKWQSEVDDAVQGKLENDAPFFYDYHFNEVRGSCSVWRRQGAHQERRGKIGALLRKSRTPNVK